MNKKKAIWITGANAGIGKALSLKFTSNSYFVIGTARRKEKFQEFNNLLKHPQNFNYYSNDISDADDISNLMKKLERDHFIECLINNAGIT